MKIIIDVSAHQGKINWEKVKPHIDGAIIRVGFGNNNIDEWFKYNISECNRLGIPVGAYWFSYTFTDDGKAQREAQYCYEAIKPYKLQLPVYFDWEYDSMKYAKKCGYTPTKAQITNWNKIFIDYMTSKGISAGYYLNYDYSKNYIDRTKLSGSEWYALYTSKSNRPSGNYDIWQYGTERYEGIDGRVDTNFLYNESIIKNVPTPEPKPEPTPTPTPVPQPTQTIKAGDLVKISAGATYYDGKTKVPSWVIADKWYVYKVSGDKATLTQNEKKNNNINSNVNIKYLTVVNASSAPAKPTTYSKGQKITLKSTPIYLSSTAKTYSSKYTGTYYLWDDAVINNRIKITSKPEYVGVANKVSAWMNVSDIK